MTEVSQVLGGQNEEMPATPEIQGIVDEVRFLLITQSSFSQEFLTSSTVTNLDHKMVFMASN